MESDEDSKEAPVASDANDRNYVPTKDDMTGESDEEETTQNARNLKSPNFKFQRNCSRSRTGLSPITLRIPYSIKGRLSVGFVG